MPSAAEREEIEAMGDMTRRSFVGGAVAAVAGGCADICGRPAEYPAMGKFIWGNLLHFGMNMWCDWKNPTPLSYGWEETVLRWPSDTVRADMGVWRDFTGAMAREKLNMAVIDIGEALVYPSHPELAAKGALTPEKMREELDRLRALGMEPVPKLNFSAGHNAWMKEYRRMMGTALYRRVCADVVADVVEVFGHPRFFHIGYDEETAGHQKRFEYIVVRNGEAWWTDFLAVVDAVERGGARAWCFSDLTWRDPETFYRRMPKTVVQCPWHYIADPNHPEYVKSVEDMLEAGYDMIPDVGTFSGKGQDEISTVNGERLFERFTTKAYPEKQLLGFLLCPWARTIPYHRTKGLKSIEYFGEMKRRWEARG